MPVHSSASCWIIETDPSAYMVEEQPETRSGLAWMETGLRVSLRDFESSVLRIRKV